MQVTPFCITWTSTGLAAAAVRRGRHRGFRYLYACGAVFGAAGLVVATMLLAANLVSNTVHIVQVLGSGPGLNATMHRSKDIPGSAGPVGRPEVGAGSAGEIPRREDAFWEVKAMVPGVNLPLLHFGYVFLAGPLRWGCGDRTGAVLRMWRNSAGRH